MRANKVRASEWKITTHHNVRCHLLTQWKSKHAPIQFKYRFLQRGAFARCVEWVFAVQKLAWQPMTAIIMCTIYTNYSTEITTMKTKLCSEKKSATFTEFFLRSCPQQGMSSYNCAIDGKNRLTNQKTLKWLGRCEANAYWLKVTFCPIAFARHFDTFTNSAARLTHFIFKLNHANKYHSALTPIHVQKQIGLVKNEMWLARSICIGWERKQQRKMEVGLKWLTFAISFSTKRHRLQ